MKAIMMSIKPQHVANILNGLKTIEVRKRFPKDYVGWVYIYVTSHKNYTQSLYEVETYKKKRKWDVDYYIPSEPGFILNGRVVARFWCDKVEEIKSCQVPFTFDQTIRDFYTDTFNDMDDLLKASCLDYYSLEQYLKRSKTGYAIHVAKLEIFYEPKEISEFKHIKLSLYFNEDSSGGWKEELEPLTRAPQSWCYIEV